MLRGGIRTRLVMTYTGLVLAIMAVAAVLLYTWVDAYYRSNIQDLLVTNARSITRFYSEYMSESTELRSAGQELARTFAGSVPARIQVYGPNGEWWGDSTLLAVPAGTVPPEGLPAEVRRALSGEQQALSSESSGSERRMHAALPLLLAGRPVGAVRLSVSLAIVDAALHRVALTLLGAVAVATACAAGLGVALARTLVAPLAELTAVAESIGRGNLTLRARRRFNDEVGRLAETINTMAHDLGELDRLRSEFIASISHELRTPLTSIKGWVVTLLDALPGEVEQRPLNPEELRPGLELIDQETDRLAGLVEELLDFGRLQSGRLRIRPATMNLAPWLHSLAEQMQPRCERLRLELTWECPPPLTVYADRDRLRQAVINLLDNAMKFTPAGGEVFLTAAPAAGGVEIWVTDNGPGIDPDDLSRVTEKFFRGRDAGAIAGTGLGLAMVSAVAEAHGGAVDVQSEKGNGTRVRMWLPGGGGGTGV